MRVRAKVSFVYKILNRRAPRLAYRSALRPSASREQRYLAYKGIFNKSSSRNDNHRLLANQHQTSELEETALLANGNINVNRIELWAECAREHYEWASIINVCIILNLLIITLVLLVYFYHRYYSPYDTSTI